MGKTTKKDVEGAKTGIRNRRYNPVATSEREPWSTPFSRRRRQAIRRKESLPLTPLLRANRELEQLQVQYAQVNQVHFEATGNDVNRSSTSAQCRKVRDIV